jgi:hypothetical protein
VCSMRRSNHGIIHNALSISMQNLACVSCRIPEMDAEIG